MGLFCCRKKKAVTRSSCTDLENEMQQLMALWEQTAERKTQAEETQSFMFRSAIVWLLLSCGMLYYPGLRFLTTVPYYAVPAMVLPVLAFLIGRKYAARKARRYTSRLETFPKDKQKLLEAFKSELPLAEALPLLQKYDPNGNHKMILPSPVHEAKIQSLTQERTLLLRAIDSLLALNNQCNQCTEQRSQSNAAKDIYNTLKPFESQLRNLRAFSGSAMDVRLLNLISGTPNSKPIPTGGMPPRSITSAAIGTGGIRSVDTRPRATVHSAVKRSLQFDGDGATTDHNTAPVTTNPDQHTVDPSSVSPESNPGPYVARNDDVIRNNDPTNTNDTNNNNNNNSGSPRSSVRQRRQQQLSQSQPATASNTTQANTDSGSDSEGKSE